MNLVRDVLTEVRYAPEWLAERELIRAEQKIIGLQRGQSEAAGPGDGRLRREEDANRRRLAEIESGGVRRLIGRAYDLQTRLPAVANWPSRFLWRGLRQVVLALRAEDRPPLPPRAQRPRAAAAAIPFDGAFAPRADAAPVGAVIHAYYPELMGELRTYLEHIPGRTDVYVSTDTEAKRAAIREAMSGWTAGIVEVRIAPNRGRDIGPKLITFRDVYDRHPVVLHLHTKKSPHDSYLRLWRYLVCETLLGSPRVVADIMAAFDQEPRLGMIAAQHYLPIKASVLWGPNLRLAQGLGARMGVTLDQRSPLDFPSGSMFWARSAALRPLLDLNLSADDFPAEAGQEDATLAHAIERLYFYACELAGFSWMKVCRPELAHISDEPLARIRQAADIKALLASTRPLLSRRSRVEAR